MLVENATTFWCGGEPYVLDGYFQSVLISNERGRHVGDLRQLGDTVFIVTSIEPPDPSCHPFLHITGKRKIHWAIRNGSYDDFLAFTKGKRCDS
jgi:hypothetical protein